MKTRDTEQCGLYYRLVTDACSKLVFVNDPGLAPGNIAKVLYPLRKCKRNEGFHFRGRYSCGKCEVCIANKFRVELDSITGRMFDPDIHPLVFFTLPLPQWPDGLPVINNCKNVGELLYWTPALLDKSSRDGFRMNDILLEFKRMAFDCVESCFPNCKIGVALFLHLSNDYLQFSPHVHGVICVTGMDKQYWPLKKVNGQFPDLAKAWRRVLGPGKRSLRSFRDELHDRWSNGCGTFFEKILTNCRQGILPGIQTENIGYQFIRQHPDAVVNIGSVISEAIRDDKKCVRAQWMKINKATGLEDPEGALGNVLRYGASGNMKTTEFRDLGAGMFSVVFQKGGIRKSCGKHDVLCRRLAQLRYASKGVRRYQLKGLFGAALGGRGTPYGRALTQEMNKGYPRTQQGAQ